MSFSSAFSTGASGAVRAVRPFSSTLASAGNFVGSATEPKNGSHLPPSGTIAFFALATAARIDLTVAATETAPCAIGSVPDGPIT